MTAEVLDGLLMDRALGALSPEVGALLEAYLAHDAAGRAEAAEIERVVGMARRAVAAEVSVPRSQLPPFDGGRRRFMWRVVAVGAGMAACVVVGFVLGNRGAGETRMEVAATGGMTVPVRVVVAGEGPGGAGGAGFWSVERLRGLAEKRNEGKRDEVVSRGDAAAKVFKTFGG